MFTQKHNNGYISIQSCPIITHIIQITVLFCSLAVLDPKVGHTMDVLSPFISILCHSD